MVKYNTVTDSKRRRKTFLIFCLYCWNLPEIPRSQCYCALKKSELFQRSGSPSVRVAYYQQYTTLADADELIRPRPQPSMPQQSQKLYEKAIFKFLHHNLSRSLPFLSLPSFSFCFILSFVGFNFSSRYFVSGAGHS